MTTALRDDSITHGPALPDNKKSTTEKRQNNASTGASAAGMRALSARMMAFYFRTPVKAFFRTRVDYLGFARAINPRVQANEAWSLHLTTPGILAHAVKTYGWSFIPNQVIPPLLANVTVGAVLYASYLQTLGALHEPSSHAAKRVYPPAPFWATYSAGFAAGTFQSIIAAPLDALQIRFRSEDLLSGRYKNMWHYGLSKSRELGPRGIYSGWSLSFVKDAGGCGLFFATFEYIKSQCFYEYVSYWYGRFGKLSGFQQQQIQTQAANDIYSRPIIKPHYLMEPSFILAAGVAASVLQQVVQHPLTQLQEVYYRRLQLLDEKMRLRPSRRDTFRTYAQAYRRSFLQSTVYARKAGGWRKWLYEGFWMMTLKQVPSTSAGLIIFEVFRRKYGIGEDEVRIEKDGYDILLP
ncbi:hypothetical protein M8818_005547 [Zalaria obscura]|uniref:Uncharacterized protein n=1 Tax=Zalaria obscura TaxID=2024903 RepID=A0ACC3SA38_9PEZI